LKDFGLWFSVNKNSLSIMAKQFSTTTKQALWRGWNKATIQAYKHKL
jgi:hypothetical protein